MIARPRRVRNIQLLLAGLLLSGCTSVQRAILEADVTNSVLSEQKGSANTASNAASDGDTATANAPSPHVSAVPDAGAEQTTALASAPPERSIKPCNYGKAISVGMTVAQVHASCWGKPKSINTAVLGTTKTEMLLYEGYNYVYVENGIVKSIETSGR